MTTGELQQALDSLRREFTGAVITADDGAYDEARTLFNTMIDKRPAVIAQCVTVADVQRVLGMARDTGLEVAVRGGGHSVAGSSLTEGGVVIDLRLMNTVDVDPDRRTATVGGGALMADLDTATGAFGLATTGGRVSTTGVGGFTLGGGSGWLERKLGFACDRLLAVELVTASGETVPATEKENSELFWALHGGGGNFGVATSLTFRLDAIPEFSIALMVWPGEAGPRVMRAYRELMADAPDEVGGGLLFFTGGPELPIIPESLHDRLTCGVLVTNMGGEQSTRRLARPLLDLEPAGEMIMDVPYAQFQGMLDDPPGHRNYWSAEHLDVMPDEAVDAFCAAAADMVVPSPSQQLLVPLGGTVARHAGFWPIPAMSSPWIVHPFGMWADPADDARGIAWAREVRLALEPWSTGAVYLNFVGDEGADRVVAGIGAENYDRLSVVKAELDPGNLFHLNHNITPRGTAAAAA